MTENIAGAVNEIAKSFGMASSEIIPHYTEWCFAQSVGFMLFGFILIGLGIFLFCKIWDNDDDEAKVAASAFLGATTFFGMVFICVNIGDVISPEAAAYMELISSLRG